MLVVVSVTQLSSLRNRSAASNKPIYHVCAATVCRGGIFQQDSPLSAAQKLEVVNICTKGVSPKKFAQSVLDISKSSSVNRSRRIHSLVSECRWKNCRNVLLARPDDVDSSSSSSSTARADWSQRKHYEAECCIYQPRRPYCCCICRPGETLKGGLAAKRVEGSTIGIALRVRCANGWCSFIC
jgi:hypothetical protein